MTVPVEVVGPERIGQKLAQRFGALRVVDQKLASPVLEEHLPASAARHQNVAVRAHAGQRDQAPAAPGM